MVRKRQSIVPLVIGFVGLLAATWVGAAENRWSSQGPFGNAVKALVVDPNSNSTVYAGIEGAGVFKTTNGGASWASTTPTPDLRVRALAIDGQDPAVVYAGTNGGGIFRSEDGGATWDDFNGMGADALINLSVLDVVVHPDDDNVLFVATNGGGVFKGIYDPMVPEVVWQPENVGLGNLVVFDLEIPNPLISIITLNEVDADTPGDAAVESAEFVEIVGPPNASLDSLALVFFDAADPIFPNASNDCPSIAGTASNPSYAAIDLDGVALNDDGFAVIGNVPGADLPFPSNGFILNTTAVVALYAGDAVDFFDDSVMPVVTTEPNETALDAMVYTTGAGAEDPCLMRELDLDGEDILNEAAGGDVEGDSLSRFPDAGTPYTQTRWTPFNNSPDRRNLPLTTILAATDLQGVFRSTEDFLGGPGGTPAPEPLIWTPLNNGLTSQVVFSLGVDPVDPDLTCALSSYTVYAGTSGQGIFKSTDPCALDQEEDWLPVNSGLPANTTVLAVAVAPVNNPSSGFESAVYLGTEDGRVFKSTDNGGSWAERSNGLGGLAVESLIVEPEIYPFEDPLRPSRIYAGTLAGGIYKTHDSASNWFLSSSEVSGLIGVFVEDVEIDPTDPDHVWAATFGGGLFESLDGGQTWPNNGLTGLGQPGSSRVYTLALDPDDPDIMYSGTDLAGGFKSIDGSATWTPMASLNATENTVFEIVLDPADNTVLYASTGDLFKSTDSGATWTDITTGSLVGTFVLNLTVDPSDSMRLFAGTQDTGLHRSLDGGMTWERVGEASLTEDFIRAAAIDPESPLTVYVGTDGSGIFKSVDGGDVWVQFNNGLPDGLVVLALEIDAEDSGILYAGTEGFDGESGGVFRSIDGGANWVPFNRGLTNFVVKDIELAPRFIKEDPLILQAATEGGGVFEFTRVERFTIEPTTGLVTTESGGVDSFTVVLTSIPSANVLLEMESSDPQEGIPAPNTLLFTPGTAFDPQTVQVTGQADMDPDGDQPYTIIFKPSISLDLNFDDVEPDNVSVLNLDFNPPPPGVTVGPETNVTTTEDGGFAEVQFVLQSVPTQNVVLTFTSGDPSEATVSPATMTFNPANAMLPQTLTITGVQDGIADGDQLFVVDATASSGDPDYEGLEVPNVTVTNIDNGLLGIYESATLGTIGVDPPDGAPIASPQVYLGAKFDVMSTVTVAKLGGHLVADGVDGTVFVAVVPLAANDFPPDTTLADDAVFATVLTAPATSAEVSADVAFALTPGRYAIMFGSGLFGATGRAKLPGVDADIGTPEYFFSDNNIPAYFDGGFSNSRFFLIGFDGDLTDNLFVDGFESGDTSAWSTTVP